MTKNQHTYDDEFRWNAVDLYVNSSKSMAEIASDLGISTGTLRDWKRKILGGSGGRGGGEPGMGQDTRGKNPPLPREKGK